MFLVSASRTLGAFMCAMGCGAVPQDRPGRDSSRSSKNKKKTLGSSLNYMLTDCKTH